MIVDTGAYVLSMIMVLIGCIFRDFIIPLFVWKKHFTGKSYSYRFWFCIITQAIIQINIVLLLGILGILNNVTYIGSNIIIYLLILWNYSDKLLFVRFNSGVRGYWTAYKEERLSRHIGKVLSGSIKKGFRSMCHWPIWRQLARNWLEYLLLFGLVIYNIWFLTHNVMLYHSYQFSDIPVHQSWIYELEQGNLYSDGIYPFGMHIMIYFVRVIFGLNLREIMLYAGAYQFVVLLIGVYLLAKLIVKGRYTPIAVILILSLLLNQGRYAAALPQESGMYAVVGLAYFMISYLHRNRKRNIIESDSKIRRFFRINSYINRRYIKTDLILMMLCVALVISYHYYTAIVAVFVVIAIGLAYIPRIFRKQYFVPLMFCGIMGALIALIPTGALLIKGVPFQESIEWATTVMSGEEWKGSEADYQDELARAQGHDVIDDNDAAKDNNTDTDSRKIDYSSMTLKEIIDHYYESIKSFATVVMYGLQPTKLMFLCMAIGLISALIMLMFKKTRIVGQDYLSLIYMMIILLTLGASQELGIPELIASSRASTFAQPFVGLVYIIPVDILLRFVGARKSPYKQSIIGALSLAICGVWGVFIIGFGWYHDFFDVYQPYYNETEYVLRNIRKSYDKYSYTIVSLTDEYYDVIDYGRHTELSKFVNMISGKEESFNFTTEYVFFFIEKTTLQDYSYGRVDVSLEYAAKDFIYMGDIQDYYFQRAVIQSKAYYWAKAFAKHYPRNFKVYFENDIYLVYLMEQNTYYPYNLQIDYLDDYKEIINIEGLIEG